MANVSYSGSSATSHSIGTSVNSMFQSIISLLTTGAVALHAILGCCVHHAHSCDSHESQHREVAKTTEYNHCSHDHCHDADRSHEVDVQHGDHHPGGDHQSCDEGDCSFVSIKRAHDLKLILAFSIECEVLSSDPFSSPLDDMLSFRTAYENPPAAREHSGSARARTQIWRL